MKIVAFANCAMSGAPWLTNLYPDAKVDIFIHTEGLLRLMKGHTIQCQAVDPPFARPMPVLTPIDVDKMDAFIWSPLADECVGISMLEDTERSPYPIDSTESHARFPPGPLYHASTLKMIWEELDWETVLVPKRFVVTYPAVHAVQKYFRDRVQTLNEEAARFFTKRGWIHYELDDELAEDRYWCHFSAASKNKLYKKIEHDIFG